MLTDEVVGLFTQERTVLSDELWPQALSCGVNSKALNQPLQQSFHVIFLLTLILWFVGSEEMRGEERADLTREANLGTLPEGFF